MTHSAEIDASAQSYYCGATELRGRLPLRCYLRDGHDGPHRDSVMGTLWWPRVTPPAEQQETSA